MTLGRIFVVSINVSLFHHNLYLYVIHWPGDPSNAPRQKTLEKDSSMLLIESPGQQCKHAIPYLETKPALHVINHGTTSVAQKQSGSTNSSLETRQYSLNVVCKKTNTVIMRMQVPRE